ncbi:MAG: barstar family protein [Lachnospiraceae bacterium]|nr:barstar family protein [Lachnospiraceae bacterium]
MKRIDLDGKLLQRTEVGHKYIQQVFSFPDYYGKNMDAFYDLLTEIGVDTEIVVSNASEMDQMMKKVLLNAELDNHYLKICLTK